MTDAGETPPDGASEPQGVTLARKYLRQVQAKWAKGIVPPGMTPALVAARERMASRKADAVDEGEFIWEGTFRYRAEAERARWARTEQIIDRIQPGQFEDGGYLELLARQAATIELHLTEAGADPQLEPFFDRILFGTTGEPTDQATTTQILDAEVITLSAGIVYLLYQTAKAVVLSWKPTESEDGVGFSARAKDTRAVLAADPAPAGLILGMLEGWLFDGTARPPDSAAPPQLYHPPLSVLINNAERFVIAHEYGHALVDHMRAIVPDGTDDMTLSQLEIELRADTFGALSVAASAWQIDRVAPNIALQGAVLALKTLDMAVRAIDIARGGDGNPAWRSQTHPPFSTREDRVVRVYQQFIQDPADGRLDLTPLRVPGETIDILWELIHPRLRAALRSGRRLHPIWQAAGQ